jgi:hypothetical protein
VKDAGITRSSSNADRTFKNTDLYRFLSGSTTTELTSTQKGRPADSTLAAYAAVQGESRTRHKAINQAICSLAARNVEAFRADIAEFEAHYGEQDLIADAIVPFDQRPLNLEFHHLSIDRCRAANMSQYVMEKLQYYAVAYNLVPR